MAQPTAGERQATEVGEAQGDFRYTALAHPDRLARTIAGPDVLLRLVGVLAVCTLLASLPFGFVRDPVGCWKVAVLFGGTVLVCVPSLQVFGAFVGRALHPAQTFALALVLSSTAAMFSLGFFPILWFLEVSMAEGERVGHRALTAVMLVAAMAAGVVQMLRTARHDDSCGPLRLLPLLLPWQILVAFVAVRMARWLGI